MKLHTCLISYNRLDLTKQAIHSYLETVTVPHTLIVVDNGSDDETTDWLILNEYDHDVLLLGDNRYPGYACNRGFEQAPADADFLHRHDNDFVFLPGWCDHVAEAFQDPQVGQVGLRTNDEELNNAYNVGGCSIVRRELWDSGMRWDERPWSVLGGVTEDYYWSKSVEERGYRWARVASPSVVNMATGDLDDPYYQESYGIRGIIG